MNNFLVNDDEQSSSMQRRKFITTLTKATGSLAVFSMPFMGKANSFFSNDAAVTVGDIMDLFTKQLPNGPIANTVDTLKAGSRDIVVTGIVTTMFATVDVIRKAIAANANFIIAHEPTFYNHADEVNWLQDDDVYQYKADLLKQHNIAVWRNHDSVHSLLVDGVREGVLTQLDWKKYDTGKSDNLILPSPQSLQALIQHTKTKLGIKEVRYIGKLTQPCKNVLLMPGAAGGKRQIEAMSKNKPDVMICGEIQEWETAEYVRDAEAKGDALSLIVLGHIASEEPGSEWMKKWLQTNVPGIPVTHIHPGNSLQFA